MQLSDLRTGQVVKCRYLECGTRFYIVYQNLTDFGYNTEMDLGERGWLIALNKNGFHSLSDYREDLTYPQDRRFDIIEVRLPRRIDCIGSIDIGDYELVWSRRPKVRVYIDEKEVKLSESVSQAVEEVLSGE